MAQRGCGVELFDGALEVGAAVASDRLAAGGSGPHRRRPGFAPGFGVAERRYCAVGLQRASGQRGAAASFSGNAGGCGLLRDGDPAGVLGLALCVEQIRGGYGQGPAEPNLVRGDSLSGDGTGRNALSGRFGVHSDGVVAEDVGLSGPGPADGFQSDPRFHEIPPCGAGSGATGERVAGADCRDCGASGPLVPGNRQPDGRLGGASAPARVGVHPPRGFPVCGLLDDRAALSAADTGGDRGGEDPLFHGHQQTDPVAAGVGLPQERQCREPGPGVADLRLVP